LQHWYPAAVQLVQLPPPLELDDDPLALLLDEADDDDVLLLDDTVELPPPDEEAELVLDEVDACSPLDDEPSAPPLPALPTLPPLEPQAVAPTTKQAQTAVMATPRAAPVSPAFGLDGALAT
jgi:hypothetical protein